MRGKYKSSCSKGKQETNMENLRVNLDQMKMRINNYDKAAIH